MQSTGSNTTSDNSTVKYLKPELYFVIRRIPVANEYSDEKVTVSQFVKKGSVLADFPTYARLKQKGFVKSPIEAGDFVKFSDDGEALIASSHGYPKVRTKEQEDGSDVLVISMTPLIKISYNKMNASIVLHPALPEIPSLQTEDLQELITSADVVFGVDEEAVAKAQEIAKNNTSEFEEIAIAQGVFPGEGTNASLHFELEIGPLAGRRLENGNIDFRDRKIMVGVHEGQHIATKTPAVPGIVGHNVLGKEIEPKTGNDLKIRVSGDAQFLEKENKVLATKDGALSVVKDGIIKVSSKTKIKDDVDYKTGNIESENNASIKGSVLPGFSVDVGGDLEIVGAVSSGLVTCGGNVVIKSGITGKTSTITCEGDADINFIERGTINAGGIVVIRKQCYYSKIEAYSDIRFHKGCTLMGGSVMAGGNLTVGDVGADNCEPALLAAGVDPERYHLFNDLKNQLIEQHEEIIQMLQRLGRGARSKKIQKLEEAADETKHKVMRLNLIPGTEPYSRIGQGKDRDDVDDVDPLYQTGIDIENIRIEVHGTVYAGTKLLVGNRSIVLTQNVMNRQYRLSKNLKRIMAVPL